MLLGNYHVIHKSPWKFRSGIGAICDNNFLKNWSIRCVYSNTYIPDQWGLPVWYYNGWMLPRKSGYISAINSALWDSTISGWAVMGINIDWLLEWLSVANATLSLIVSTSWVAGGIAYVSSSVAGVIFGSGQSLGSSSGIALLWALASIIAFSQWASDANVNIRADWYMTGTVSPFTELSPQWLAQAVWLSLASENNVAGSMGQKVNAAASGWVDYDILADAVVSKILALPDGVLTPTQVEQLINTFKKGDSLLNLDDILISI